MAQALTMTPHFPLISVVMPVFNGEAFLRETIDSVLKQTYQNFEFIIVNDGSTDNTQNIINSYHDTRIVPTHLPRNAGVSNARNTGINLAKGKYIAFCDSDDIYLPERLQSQYDFLEAHLLVDVCGSAIIFFEHGHERLIAAPESDIDIKELFLRGNPIAQPTVMGKADIFKKYKYNATLQASEDYDLWTRMAVDGVVFGNLSRPMVRYRAHELQASRTKGKLLDTTFKATCANYTLAYLKNNKLAEYASAPLVSLNDFTSFIEELAQSAKMKDKNINLFLPLIALQYKKLSKHTLINYLSINQLYRKYQILFPRKYNRNIFLLSIFPVSKKYPIFDTLTKLKYD